MPPSVPKQTAPLVLVCGEDDFAVKQRAKQIYLQWTEELGGMDHEVIDAAVVVGGVQKTLAATVAIEQVAARGEDDPAAVLSAAARQGRQHGRSRVGLSVGSRAEIRYDEVHDSLLWN